MSEELAEIRMCLNNDMNVDNYCVMWLLTQYEKLQDEVKHLRGSKNMSDFCQKGGTDGN